MKLKLMLLSLALLGAPALAADIELPEGFTKDDFYFDSLIRVDTIESEVIYVRKGKKVVSKKFEIPFYIYKTSSENISNPIKIPGVKDTRPFKEQHPNISKVFKVGSLLLSPVDFLLNLTD